MSPTPEDHRPSRTASKSALSRRRLLRASGGLLAGAALSGRAVGAQSGGGDDADAPAVAWNRTYGDEFWQRARSVVQAPDGGFVVAGETVDDAGGYAALVVRTDADGDVMWTQTYGDQPQGAIEILDVPRGGYTLVLDARTPDSYDNHVAAMGIDEDGAVQWRREYEFGNAYVDDAVRRSDGGYAVVGTTSPDDAPAEAFLLTLDAEGERERVETYDAGDASLFGQAVVEADDGFGLLTFTTPENVNWSPVLVRTGPDGTERWRRQYEIRGVDVGEGMVRAADGGFVIAGSARGVVCDKSIPDQPEWISTDPDAFLLKVDAEGRRQWAETYSAPGPGYASAEADVVVRRPDGGYAFAGERSASGSNPFWVVGTDASGELLWEQTAGGRDYNYVFSMIRTTDDGYAVTGITTDQHPAEPDVRLVRLTADS